MAKNISDKSRYESRYSEGYITEKQYIVELICERKAANEGKELPIRFWKLPEWEKYFRSQVNTASALCKKYRPAAIIKALLNPKNRKTYSLRSPFLEKSIIEEHNAILIAEKQTEINKKERAARDSSAVIGTNERPKFNKGNRINTLMELDDGKEEKSGD